MAAFNDPDVMYYHQAMAAPDHKEFMKAMQEEINGQVKNNNFTIIPLKVQKENVSFRLYGQCNANNVLP
jgi:hypothetical protein